MTVQYLLIWISVILIALPWAIYLMNWSRMPEEIVYWRKRNGGMQIYMRKRDVLIFHGLLTVGVLGFIHLMQTFLFLFARVGVKAGMEIWFFDALLLWMAVFGITKCWYDVETGLSGKTARLPGAVAVILMIVWAVGWGLIYP